MSIAPISLLGMLFVSSGTPHVATVGADANRARDFDEAIIVCNETYLPNSMAHTNKDGRDQRSRWLAERRVELIRSFANTAGIQFLQYRLASVSDELDRRCTMELQRDAEAVMRAQ